jgi:hypothetical protein
MSNYTGPIRRVDTTYRGKPTHHYEDANGQRVPGVTTILGDGWPKPALVPWGIKSVAEYAVNNREELAALPPTEMLATLKGAPYRERDAAAKRGTEVHKLAEALVQGDEVTVPAELERHVAHYVEFLDAFKPQPILVEPVVYNLTYGYAGSADLVADIGGETWLLDLKTNRSGVFPEVAYQLAAYRYAEFYIDGQGQPQPMISVDRCAVIHVNGKGWQVVPVLADEAVLKAFRHIAVVYREKDRNGAYLGEPLTSVTA